MVTRSDCCADVGNSTEPITDTQTAPANSSSNEYEYVPKGEISTDDNSDGTEKSAIGGGSLALRGNCNTLGKYSTKLYLCFQHIRYLNGFGIWTLQRIKSGSF